MSRDMTKPTKWLDVQRRLRSAWASAQSDQSSLSAWRNLGFSASHWAHCEDSDQTGRMPRLIWVFAGRTLILLVLLCRGSFEDKNEDNSILSTWNSRQITIIISYVCGGRGGGGEDNSVWVYNIHNTYIQHIMAQYCEKIMHRIIQIRIIQDIWAASWQTQQNGMSAQRRLI